MQVTKKEFCNFYKMYEKQIINITELSFDEIKQIGILDENGFHSSNLIKICFVYNKTNGSVTHRLYQLSGKLYAIQKVRHDFLY
ncbi:hypothetical protein [Campylobacter sp. RM12651]|uniref:hypothetical protein n=1 Tax=Campylobacter sp. RM12651 TaxID=1660079 RepID=UPI001EFB936C|nr:hypothetical protein [Campylobacter sp. RM12651]ULO03731.1 hypothetical protein AVBRAN_1276 [Campylobacter sp. RM12651]